MNGLGYKQVSLEDRGAILFPLKSATKIWGFLCYYFDFDHLHATTIHCVFAYVMDEFT